MSKATYPSPGAPVARVMLRCERSEPRSTRARRAALSRKGRGKLVRQRVGAELEPHRLGLVRLAAFEMEHGPLAVS